MTPHRRILSERFFTRPFVCNQLIDLIRAFASRQGLSKCPLLAAADWSSSSVRDHCVDKIVKVCAEAKSLLARSGPVVKLASPCYVIGDIHGNLHDLLVYEQTLWKLGPYLSPCNLLFL